MKRTRVQTPAPLYSEIKRVAELQDWSTTEVLRQGAEYMVRCYPPSKDARAWPPPAPRRMGRFLAPVDQWRDVANAPLENLGSRID